MRPGRLPILDLLVSGIAAAAISGFLASVALILLTRPDGWPVFIIPFSLWAAAWAIVVVTLPAMLLGGILTGLRVDHPAIWAAVGLAVGLSLHIFTGGEPAQVGPANAPPSGILPTAIDAAIGALAALTFRKTMRVLAGRRN
jgi:hypothetical protein